MRALLRRSSRWAQATVAVSDQVRDNLAAWGVVDRPGHRVLVVRNGIDTDELRFDAAARARLRAGLGVSEDVEVVGIVCRLHPWKRVDVALEGLAPSSARTGASSSSATAPNAPACRPAPRS